MQSSFTHCNLKNRIDFSFNLCPLIDAYSQNTNYIYIKTQLPKLPFFCSMDDKFRNKFNVFLKIRTGNDESYRMLIQNSNK